MVMSKSKSKNNTKQDLLYIKSESCGWCKKADPVVDELVKDGAKITTLDVMNPEDQKRINEIKQKYSAQCGTPFFIDAESGNQICGFREKDVLQKWVNGEEIPKPPQPKSPPPPPPQNFDDENEIKEWTGKYETWAEENKHLPKIMPADQVIERMKQAKQMREQQMQAQQAGVGTAPAGNPGTPGNIQVNTEFYYVVLNNKKEVVMADTNFINSLQHQYFQRENDGRLTKVTGDTTFAQKYNQNNQPSPQPQNVNVQPQVQKQLDQMKKEQDKKKKEASKASKKNKKTIKGL
tara:strand:- start:280 stop:1155 length:876 start_codon:yes stop_codon:yes gene_type:complete